MGGSDRHVEVSGIDDALTLKLHPHPIHASTWKDEAEQHLGTAVRERWMLVQHVDQVIARREHVAPRTKQSLNPRARAESTAHLRWLTGNRIWRVGLKGNLKVAILLLRIVAPQSGWRTLIAGHEDGLCQQLRRGGFRIEVTQHSIHARLREHDVVCEHPVFPDRMVVEEKLQVATYDEGMEQLFVNDAEPRDPVTLPGIEDLERETDVSTGKRRRIDRQV